MSIHINTGGQPADTGHARRLAAYERLARLQRRPDRPSAYIDDLVT